jgi:hypothetical protein
MIYTGQAQMVEVDTPVVLGAGEILGVLTIMIPGGTQGNVFIGGENVNSNTGVLLRTGQDMDLQGSINLEDIYVLFTSPAASGQMQRACWYSTDWK